MDSSTESWSEGEADVPFIYPEAFKEVSSITAYSMEEMTWMLASQLREQYQRHFMIRRPGEPTIAGVTPFVKTFKVRPDRITTYIEKCLDGFLTSGEVDRAIEGIHRQIQREAGKTEFDPDDYKAWEEKD